MTTATQTCTGPGSKIIYGMMRKEPVRVECSACGGFHAPLLIAPAIPVRHAPQSFQEYVAPVKYWITSSAPGEPMTDAQVSALAAERDQLVARLPSLAFVERIDVERIDVEARIREIERVLTHDRKLREAQRRDQDRASERRNQTPDSVNQAHLAERLGRVLSAPENKGCVVDRMGTVYVEPKAPLGPELRAPRQAGLREPHPYLEKATRKA